MLLVGKGFTRGEFFETTIGCVVGIVMLAAALSRLRLGANPRCGASAAVLASVLVISRSRVATP